MGEPTESELLARIRELEQDRRILARRLEHSEQRRAVLEEGRDKREALLKSVIGELRAKNDSLVELLESLRRTQEQLVQSEKMASLGLLVAGIAHEIKNPLNFVNNFAELGLELIEEFGAPDVETGGDVTGLLREVAENLSRIRAHGRRADGIVNAMLMHARKQRGEVGAVDFNTLVVDNANLAYQGFRASDKSFRVEVVEDLDPALGTVMLPYQELARVVVNLVSNACHAMRQRQRVEPMYGPTLCIGTRREGTSIALSIVDNGTGIAPEVRSRIFDPFFTTRPPGEGTGLGLSLSYEIIVKELGGSIEVESVPGEGARFTVRVPASSTST